ncbi:MAG: hypothetical protein JXA50_01870 [Deltaproteobacteria bacterium]|nr:hypothetical protein [Deltaproteobacteria bacterium]
MPQTRNLKEAGLFIPAFGWDCPPLPLKLEGDERYYCARLDTAPLGGVGKRLGYVLIGQRNGTCRRITVDYRGIRFDNPSPAELNIRDSAWRKGI